MIAKVFIAAIAVLVVGLALDLTDVRLLSPLPHGNVHAQTPPDSSDTGTTTLDYVEHSPTSDGTAYWVILQAEDDGKTSEYDIPDVPVTGTKVNELGKISGEVEPSAFENYTGTIARYEVDDPEEGNITWSLSGPDAPGFEIDGEGSLTPVDSLDFEAPSSAAGSNVHSLTITATDDGTPELSAQINVTVNVVDVNEAPVAAAIPLVDLTARRMPWPVDLGEYFTDPDSDMLFYQISGAASTDVAHAAVDGETLSITPAGEGKSSFYVVASDPGGLRVVSKIDVSVTGLDPVPAKVIWPVPSATPGTISPAEAAYGPPLAGELLWQISERRYPNSVQQPDSVAKTVVGFAIDPVDPPMKEAVLPSIPASPTLPAAPPTTSASPAPAPELSDVPSLMAPAPAEQGASPQLVDTSESGSMQLWLVVLLALVAVLIVGYIVYMLVINRVSQSLWMELSELRALRSS